MNLLDILLALPLCWLIFQGWKKGVVRESATLAGVVAGIWAAVHFSQWVATWLHLTGDSSILVAFFITFVGVLVLVWLLGRSIEGLLKAAKLTLANKIAGATLGMAKGLCILAVVLNGIVMLDRGEHLITPATKEKSLLYTPVYSTGNLLISSLKDFIAEHRDLAEQIIKTDKEECK